MENYDQIIQVINFWSACFFFVLMIGILIVHICDITTEVGEYISIVLITLIGTFFILKAGILIWCIIILLLPFLIIWQIRKFIIKKRFGRY